MAIGNQHQNGNDFTFSNPNYGCATLVPPADDRFAILGHEIRNPLSALNFALEAWPSSKDKPQLEDELLQIMRRQVAQLTRLCNDLLDAGKMAQRNFSICGGTLDMVQVIKIACEEIRPFIAQRGLTMTVAIDERTLTLHGDESKLTQVFANLLHNAAKFTDRPGHLHISLEKDRDTAVVRVRDNGCGMCVDQVQDVFRLPCTSMDCSQRAGDGLGIGLRLVKSIVEFHGGTIEAFSEGVGCGSTFVVTLPLANALPPQTIAMSTKNDGQNGKQRPPLPHYRIVVVDDDRSLRLLMSRLLTTLKQSVTVADSGEAALQAIVQSQPDVVFMDLRMHGMSGYEVAREVRKRADWNDVVLIALSGSADATSRQLAAEAGFDQYLVKPISVAELTEALLGISPARKRNVL